MGTMIPFPRLLGNGVPRDAHDPAIGWATLGVEVAA